MGMLQRRTAARVTLLALLGASATVRAADAPPPDAAVQNVFTQTVEQASAPVPVKLGQNCEKAKVRGFRVLKRGPRSASADLPQGYYPITAEVELQCGSAEQVQRWNGQLEIQLYQNSAQAWTMRW